MRQLNKQKRKKGHCCMCERRKDGLVSLFNGISTFVGYLMPKLFSKKNSSDTI